jgi:SAM-dependent methyltransferase
MGKLIELLKSNLWRALLWGFTRLNNRALGDFAYQLISDKVKMLSAEEALRLLFTTETRLYYLEKNVAVDYGKGIHPKHRHMRYHDFFVKRITAESKVLDVGCGNGMVDYDVAQKSGAQVLGIDLSKENIELASKLFPHPNIQYMVGDALTDLPDQHFDYVILSNVLEHIEARVEFLLALQQSASPGVILIRVPLFERDWRVPLKRELGLEWRLDTDHKTEYTLESFQSEMSEAGLKIQHQEVRWGEIWAEVAPNDG